MSATSLPPVAVRSPVVPEDVTRKAKRASPGSAAAAREVTTSTSRNPPAALLVASSTRFTPGSTFKYPADDPDTTGVGSRPGHHTDSCVPDAAITAIGPVPPPEKLTVSSGTAAGTSRPSAARASLVFTATQRPDCRTRTGSTFIFAISCPSGSAVTLVVPDVNALTVCATPVALARVAAADSAACTVPLDDCPPSTASFPPVDELSGTVHADPRLAAAPPGAADTSAPAVPQPRYKLASVVAAAKSRRTTRPRTIFYPCQAAGPLNPRVGVPTTKACFMQSWSSPQTRPVADTQDSYWRSRTRQDPK